MKELKAHQYCVIMAGGIGSRFWPMSTQKYPKQFLDILGTGRTMIQQTFDRISKIIDAENIFVITNAEYLDLAKEQLPNIPADNIVGEPLMKNTAACILFMANKIAQADPVATMIVMPADHLILKEYAFLTHATHALQTAAEKDWLITLGITPTRPDTGYGYIQYRKDEGKAIFPVKTFTEKPTLEIAQSFLESGEFLWNAGIFFWSVSSITKAFAAYLPDMTEIFEQCRYNTPHEHEDMAIAYPKAGKYSIDTAIMEKAENVYVIPADLGWSDLGTWTSIYEHAEKDDCGNATNRRQSVLHNTQGTLLRTINTKKMYVLDGLQDYIVVDTEKALLVCPRKNDQQIKEYVQEIRSRKNGEEYI